jgi:arylsulfatase A-like enzyme
MLAALATLAAVALATARCASGDGDGSSGAAARAAPPAVQRLLDHLDDARFDLPRAAPFFGRLDEAAAADLLLVDEMRVDAPYPGRWRSRPFVEAAIETGEAANAIAPRDERPRREAIGGGERDVVTIAAGGLLLATVAVDESASCLLRAWVRPLAPPPTTDGAAPTLAFAPLDHVPPEGDALARDLMEHAAEFARRPRVAALPADAACDAWHELRVVARPYPGRRALGLAVDGGARGVALDRVELRRLTPAEALALSGDETVEPATHPLRRRVELDLETWDCAALPCDGSVEFDVDVPAGAARLDLGLAALAERAEEKVALDVTARAAGGAGDAVALATIEASADETATRRRWRVARVALDRFAGRRVTLRFAVRGARGSVALLGAPTVLGASDPRPDVVVISLDTLRADHVGCYGGTAVATPAIDALAARGLRFARVLSPASYTLPTHLSMLSGQDPLVHDTVASTDPMDPLRTLPLAARLRAAGWRTGAFTAGGLVHPRYGFGVGFDRYSIRDPGGVVGLHRRIGDARDDDAQPGEDRVGEALDWLAAGGDAPSFLFLHTYLVHNYRPRQEWLDRTVGGTRPTPQELTELREQAAGGDETAIARLRALYAASLAQADAEIVARVLYAIAKSPRAERTLVVLTADHGEEFFEHRMIGHGDELWHTLTQVPWIMAGPGVPRGEVRESPVALADVAATIAGRLALPPDPRVLSIDRLAAAQSSDDAPADTEPLTLSLRRIADHPDQDALVLWPWKLVRRRIGDRPWPLTLYRIDDDPREAHDLAAAEPARATGMQRLLDAKLADHDRAKKELPHQDGPRKFEPSPELDRMLDQLGYTHKDDE